MQVRNCSKCGKLFMYVSKRICPDCQKETEEEFERIRVYVKAHPGSSVTEISEALEVDFETIEEFVRQGRSDVIVEGISVSCDRCGTEIRIGRYCEKCLQELDQELRDSTGSARPAAPDRERQGMYTSGSLLKDDRRK